jgi:hypothetical protein
MGWCEFTSLLGLAVAAWPLAAARHQGGLRRPLGVLGLPLATASMMLLNAFAASGDDIISDPEIAGLPSSELGVWRVRTQQVFEPIERKLLRRRYEIWDSTPSNDLDFIWIPASKASDKEGKVTGEGRLIWRFKGRPAYDPASFFSEFRGTMRDGRPEGRGTYSDRTGLAYEGEWKGGRMEGYGVLKLPNGDEYAGQMRAGKAEESGRYVDFTGEVFVGRFTNGLRDGRGATTLPNGNSYASDWVNGRETPDSRQVRVAQASGQPMPGGDDDIRIGVTVDRKGAREGDLRYLSSNRGAGLFIRPDNQRLMVMWKASAPIELTEQERGGDQYGVFSLSRGQLFPLTLVMEVQNRSSVPIHVTSAFLSVASSTSELQPAIQLNTGRGPCDLGGYGPTFSLENFGWGVAEDAALKFAFAGPALGLETADLTITRSIGQIDKRLEVDLEPELKAAGVDTKALAEKSERGFSCSSKNREECLKEIRSTGFFGSLQRQIGIKDFTIFVRAAGLLSYRWRDSKGAVQQSSSPFNANVALGHVTIEAECGEGGEPEPIPSNPLKLDLDRSNYQVPLEFNRTIAEERRSRLAVTIASEKSSWSEFNFVVRLSNDREIRSRSINLLYYVPSWFPPP